MAEHIWRLGGEHGYQVPQTNTQLLPQLATIYTWSSPPTPHPQSCDSAKANFSQRICYLMQRNIACLIADNTYSAQV